MSEKISINFSYIEKERYNKGLTQRELASKIGVSQASYSRWIKGIDRPGINYVKKISKLLNIPLDKLIENNPGSANQSLTKQDIKEAVSEALLESGCAICPLMGKDKFINRERPSPSPKRKEGQD